VETLSFYAMVKRLNLCDEIIDERNKRSFIWSLKKRIVGKRQRLNKWIIHNIYPDFQKIPKRHPIVRNESEHQRSRFMPVSNI
jgi:hypothetical protein